jgi:hypothetical protein
MRICPLVRGIRKWAIQGERRRIKTEEQKSKKYCKKQFLGEMRVK